MRVLVQRVKQASVCVEGRIVVRIGPGLLLFVGIGKQDEEGCIEDMAGKISGLRIFKDRDGKMNLNITQAGGEVLSIPQFTLYADTKKGNRPGFDLAASPDKAKDYWRILNNCLVGRGLDVKIGTFGAHMDIELINDGPVTIWLETKGNRFVL